MWIFATIGAGAEPRTRITASNSVAVARSETHP